jgi:hypothetical protein
MESLSEFGLDFDTGGGGVVNKSRNLSVLKIAKPLTCHFFKVLIKRMEKYLKLCSVVVLVTTGSQSRQKLKLVLTSNNDDNKIYTVRLKCV